MARFYGFSHREIQSMEYETFLGYVKAIDVLRAREQLMDIDVVSYPNAKKDSKQKIHKKIHQRANPDIWGQPKKVLTTEEIARMLKRG